MKQSCQNGSCNELFDGAPGLCPKCKQRDPLDTDSGGIHFYEKSTGDRIDVVPDANPKANVAETLATKIGEATIIHEFDGGLMQVYDHFDSPALECSSCRARFALPKVALDESAEVRVIVQNLTDRKIKV